MRSCRCCEEDCAGGHSAADSAGWWVDFSGGFSYLSPEYQRAFCAQSELNSFALLGVDCQQFLPSLEPLRDSILVQGEGAVNWTTCGWSNMVGRVDRWQTFLGNGAWSNLIGTLRNCMPENELVSSTPFDYRAWRLDPANDDYATPQHWYIGNIYGIGITWYGEAPPDPTTLENYCQNDHPEGIGENNLEWKCTDRFCGFVVDVTHAGGTDENGDEKQRLTVTLTMHPYCLNNEYYFYSWPYGQTPDDYEGFLTNPGTYPGLYPPWYDERSLWHAQPMGDGTIAWVNPTGTFRSTFFSNQPIGRYNVLFQSPDRGIKNCQRSRLTDGRAGQLGTSNTIDDHQRIWRTDWLEGDQIDGVTPHVLNFVTPGTPELNWWDWLGLVNLPETLTLTPIKVDELIDITGEEPQQEPEE